MSGQSRRASLAESLANMVIAYAVSMGIGYVVYPMFGFNVTPSQNFWLVFIFTVASLIRSYFVRRLFNHFHVRSKA